ncbi:hypothetical protein N0V90_008955 [Kalmusia sp. IMI 367209]|nr:hypothetical protein N0V90_008955 [Kalmusia sp. IMI 367209]
MERESQDKLMRDADTGYASYQVSPTDYDRHLPTHASSKFPGSLSEVTASPSSMTDDFTSGKGKGKRPAEEDIETNCTGSAAVPKIPSRIMAPRIVRRHHHRLRNVAATVWGPSLPDSTVPQRFNTYKAILRHPNLFFHFAIRLPPQTIIDLYAIDKEFHYRFNKYSTSIIHDFASYHAPQAAYIFSWVHFPELCISDPMLRPMDGRPHLARDIPSLRWTKMVLFRDNIVRGMLTILGVEGHSVPRNTNVVLMKFWLLMEMPTTALRKALLSDKEIWSDQDIYFFHLFFIKLNMHFSHPIFGHGFMNLSHMLLTQKSLTTLYRLLIGKYIMDYDEATDMLVRTYLLDDLDVDTHSWLADETENGVPMEETSILCRENWDWQGDPMKSPVDMLFIEGIKRRLRVQQYLLDFMTYGYIDRDTMQNMPTPQRWRGEKKIHVPKESWPTEDVRAGLVAKLDKKFGIERKKEVGRMVRLELRNNVGGNSILLAWDLTPKKESKVSQENQEDKESAVDGMEVEG